MLTLPSTVTCVPLLAGDTLDNSNGIVWDMAWLYRYNNGGLTVTPVSVQWNSENQERILLWRIAQRVRSQRSAWL